MNCEKITTWILAGLALLLVIIASDLHTQLSQDCSCNCKNCGYKECKNCGYKDCNCKNCCKNCCKCGENKDKNVDVDLPENPRYPNGRKVGNVNTKTKEK